MVDAREEANEKEAGPATPDPSSVVSAYGNLWLLTWHAAGVFGKPKGSCDPAISSASFAYVPAGRHRV